MKTSCLVFSFTLKEKKRPNLILMSKKKKKKKTMELFASVFNPH